jgi:hypothetical protein
MHLSGHKLITEAVVGNSISNGEHDDAALQTTQDNQIGIVPQFNRVTMAKCHNNIVLTQQHSPADQLAEQTLHGSTTHA